MLGDDISLSLFPSGAVTFHKVMFGDNHSTRPTADGRRIDGAAALFSAACRAHRDRRRDAGASGHQRQFAAERRIELVGTDRLAVTRARPQMPTTARLRSRRSAFRTARSSCMAGAARTSPSGSRTSNFKLAWPSISRSFGANGRFVWNEQPIEASFTLERFSRGVDRRTFRHESAAFPARRCQLAFDGRRARCRRSRSTARSASTRRRCATRCIGPAARRLPVRRLRTVRVARAKRYPAAACGAVQRQCRSRRQCRRGRDDLVDRGSRTVQGTLAADALDLTPYLSGMYGCLARNSAIGTSLPIALDGFGELRSRSAAVRGAASSSAMRKLGRTAVAANMRDGKLDSPIGEAEAFGGTAKGYGRFQVAKGGVAVASHVQFTRCRSRSMSRQLFGVRKLAGRGNIAMNIEGSGMSVDAGGDQHAQWHGEPERPCRRDRRDQCRAIAAAAAAPAAFGQRRLPLRARRRSTSLCSISRSTRAMSWWTICMSTARR